MEHKYEIEKSMVFSTAHITKDDNEKLEVEATTNSTPILVVYRYEYGFLIFVHPDKEDGEFELIKEHYSQELFDLVKLAHDNKCTYLKLDCDGQEFKHLKTFDW